MTTLELGGTTIAKQLKSDVWSITRIDPFGKGHTVVLTAETIKFLAETIA